jgi:hypothetical protein
MDSPTIMCNQCYKRQDYRGQAVCNHCGKRLNNWSVASQLMIQKFKEALEREKK